MYSDNDTATDLLGFEDQVDDLCAIVQNPALLPITVGVLGDWGSGKSSLLRMAQSRLEASGIVVVPFSPWRIESYDDTKSSLLEAVVTAVDSYLAEYGQKDEKSKALATKALSKIGSLRKRVRWFRAAGLAAKHIITLSAPTLDEMDRLLRDENDDQVATTARVAHDFHIEFAALVAQLPATLVILVDDLDRCLPEQVLDVLQAIRLFLSVPGTAFVLATDERVVRDAVRLRYPQAASASETDLPQEYLEKIIQVPLRIPPLGSAEVEAYLNLLVAERHLDPNQLDIVRTRASELRSSGLSSIAMNIGIARECLGEGTLPADAERDFELVGRIGRLLSAGLKGNPRQVKRFLNALELRRRAVDRRKLAETINDSVLAKLAVLEYVHLKHFRTLHKWQLAADGRPPQIAAAECALTPQQEPEKPGTSRNRPAPPALDTEVAAWLETPWLKSWLSLEPSLAAIDLAPYFVLSKDALHESLTLARRLPDRLQTLLIKLASPSQAQREAAVRAVNEQLTQEDSELLFAAATERLPTEPDPMNLAESLIALATGSAERARVVLASLADLPYTAINIGTPMKIKNRLGPVATAEVMTLLDKWETQSAEPRLSRAASQARSKSASA